MTDHDTTPGDTDREFTITRTFAAPRQLIWQAWTDPAIAAQWWHPAGFSTDAATVHVDLREGGSYGYVMTSPEGDRYPTGGRYLAVREPDHLRFTWGEPDDGDAAPIISIDLTDAGDNTTEMTFHMAGVANDSGASDSVYDGWSEAFTELDTTLSMTTGKEAN